MNLDGLLAGITHLSVNGRGPRDAYVFDPHRLAFPCWARAVESSGPALLVTLDRHFDLVPAANPPPPGLTVLAYDEHARRQLDVRNYDHILAAMEAGLISGLVAIARAKPVGCFEGETWVDSRGGAHRILRVPTIERLSDDFGTPRALTESRQCAEWLTTARNVILDVDLDCFTSPSDVDPLTPLPWPEAVLREFLQPQAEPFWNAVLSKCSTLTLAREPLHCGGLIATGRLFEVFSRVMFGEILCAGEP